MRVSVTTLLFCLSLGGQWIDHPTAGVPRGADGKPNLAAPAPKGSDGKPDLSGLWQRARRVANTRGAGLAVGSNLEDYMRAGERIPELLPDAQKLYQARLANFMADRPSGRCLPHSIPDQMLVGVPFKVVQNPGLTVILYEEFARFRQVFTDGRGHAPIASPAWLGYSIGKWNGDWFEIDTRGYNDRSWLDDSGRPHSEQLHTVERFHRRDFGHMDAEIVIDDPGTYKAIWSFPMQFDLLVDTEMIEDVCDNERDSGHAVRK